MADSKMDDNYSQIRSENGFSRKVPFGSITPEAPLAVGYFGGSLETREFWKFRFPQNRRAVHLKRGAIPAWPIVRCVSPV